MPFTSRVQLARACRILLPLLAASVSNLAFNPETPLKTLHFEKETVPSKGSEE